MARKKSSQEFLKMVGYFGVFILLLLAWFLADLLFPEFKTTGTGDIFLKGGYVAAFVIVLALIVYTKFPKEKFLDVITGTWERTTVRNILLAFFGSLIIGALANAQGASIGQYSVIPLFTAATAPFLGVFSYMLNAPIEDVLFIATPWLVVGILARVNVIKFDPFKGSDIERYIAVFLLTGTVATIAHLVSRGGTMWFLNPLAAADPGVFIIFASLGLIAKEYGMIVADAAHMGLNAGLVLTAFSVVV